MSLYVLWHRMSVFLKHHWIIIFLIILILLLVFFDCHLKHVVIICWVYSFWISSDHFTSLVPDIWSQIVSLIFLICVMIPSFIMMMIFILLVRWILALIIIILFIVFISSHLGLSDFLRGLSLNDLYLISELDPIVAPLDPWGLRLRGSGRLQWEVVHQYRLLNIGDHVRGLHEREREWRAAVDEGRGLGDRETDLREERAQTGA